MPSSLFAAGIRVLVLALQLFGGIFPSSTLVLCVAADGHTDVEVAHAGGRCLTDYQRHHPEVTGACALDQHGCVDVILSQQPLCSTVASEGSAINQGPALPGATLELFPPTAPPFHRNTVATRTVDSHLSARRTIVLIV